MNMKNEYDIDFEQYGSAGNGSLRWISMLVMIMVVFGFFSLIWYAYEGGSDSQPQEEIAMIAPEQDRYKIKPLDAGGMPVENKDIEAYQLMRRSPDVQQEVDKVETLLSDTEQPLKPMERTTPQDPAMMGEMQKIEQAEHAIAGSAPQNTETLMQAQAPVAPIATDTINQAAKEWEQKEQEMRALEEAAKQKAAQEKAALQADIAQSPSVSEPTIDDAIQQVTTPVTTQPTPPAPVVAPVVKAQPQERPLSSVQKQPVLTTETVKKAPPAPVAPAPVKAVATPAPAPAAGTYIQFAAMRSASDAGKVWGGLQAKHPELSPYSYYTESVQVAGTGTLYRLRAKGFASRTQALTICNAIKARGQDCLVSAQ